MLVLGCGLKRARATARLLTSMSEVQRVTPGKHDRKHFCRTTYTRTCSPEKSHKMLLNLPDVTSSAKAGLGTTATARSNKLS